MGTWWIVRALSCPHNWLPLSLHHHPQLQGNECSNAHHSWHKCLPADQLSMLQSRSQLGSMGLCFLGSLFWRFLGGGAQLLFGLTSGGCRQCSEGGRRHSSARSVESAPSVGGRCHSQTALLSLSLLSKQSLLWWFAFVTGVDLIKRDGWDFKIFVFWNKFCVLIRTTGQWEWKFLECMSVSTKPSARLITS